MNLSASVRFFQQYRPQLLAGEFVKCTLGHPATAEQPLRKLLLRPVVVKGEKRCSVVSRFLTRDETKNPSFEEMLRLLEAKMGSEFLSLNLFTESEEIQLELGKREKLRVTAANLAPATMGHDRLKSRKVDAKASYLRALGVTDSRSKVRERMGDKFRQIERFVDLLHSAYQESSLPTRSEVHFCDMGAGKGYLTFAAYDFLSRQGKPGRTQATGVEHRDDLVTLCNGVAEESGFTEGLRFVQSSIDAYSLEKVDILVALHACNTATDDALAAGIKAGAEIILAAPCCHKEIRPQVDRDEHSGPLADVLRFGIFAERHAEMATDALRALLLEQAGYKVRVSEFVAAEHTAKNVMLIATRRQKQEAIDLTPRIAALKEFYGIRKHRLEELLLG